MKDGYYWARKLTFNLDARWEIVEVRGENVSRFRGGYSHYLLVEFEFGDRIEIPEKYK